jgi:hypothetical protein
MTANDISNGESRPTVTEPADIHSRAMLVSVRCSFWGANVTDKQVTDEVNREHAASRDAGKYRKHLFANNAPEHRAAVRASVQARMILWENSLPWKDDGWRLLPSAAYMTFSAKIREQHAALDAAVDALLARYDELKKQARADLNGLYREQDYPSPADVRARFGIAVEFAPLPSGNDFRLELPDEERRVIADSVTRRVAEAIDVAMRDAWDRLYQAVRHMGERIAARAEAERAEGKDGKLPPFHRSVVTNLIETAEALGALNVTGDPSLEAMRQRVIEELGGFSVEDIKTDDLARIEAAARVDSILAAMSDFYQPTED